MPITSTSTWQAPLDTQNLLVQQPAPEIVPLASGCYDAELIVIQEQADFSTVSVKMQLKN